MRQRTARRMSTAEGARPLGAASPTRPAPLHPNQVQFHIQRFADDGAQLRAWAKWPPTTGPPDETAAARTWARSGAPSAPLFPPLSSALGKRALLSNS